ncbi:aminoglycoside phosphotransferase family protein [Crocinitomicaceae bacterium]|nr:aminoglycoside phosphotransferase family protein [Crocinitomicaceae bacterium]
MDECLKIARYFLSDVSKNNTEISIVESGLINHTFKLKHLDQAYILQKLNLNVFKNPAIIHKNYSRVNNHLSTSKYPKHKLEFIKSFDGNDLALHKNEVWRISRFIEGETRHVCNSIEMAFNAAEALAEFHLHLQDFDVNLMSTPIPHFCDFKFRTEEFKKAVIYGNKERRIFADYLIQEIGQNLHLIKSYIELEELIPQRVIHGDPKVSNFLFSKKSNSVLSIIDIDTIMPGMILYDFGDMVRSFSNTLKEDDSSGTVAFNKEIYDALYKGYIKPSRQFISTKEFQNLHLSAICISLVQSIRFLTDFLNDDGYYKVSYENQNFDRASNQFSFFKEIKDYVSL